jgi:F-type H+-transporting ATPase subunit gamma
MANLRDIRNRINSVENTKQVTRAMKMVAAAKLRKAQERIFNTRPYAFKIREIVDHLQEELDPTAHEFFQQREEINGVLLVIITADRGLAGAFNSNVIKKAEETIEESYRDIQKAGNLYLLCVGRKGHEHFSKRDYQVVGDYRGVFDSLSFKTAASVVEDAIEGFRRELWDEVDVVYNEFKNTIAQNRIVEPLLPIPEETFTTPIMKEELTGETVSTNGQEIDYIFEPGAKQILDELVPRYLNYQVWRALLESNAAEQGARMVAMDNATSNAEDLLEDLRITYNRERQNAITMEILDITSGAEALGDG